ncbi:MAG: RNA-directed DNA polymerase [Bacteroidaceae bacterium]|nr:RNA-directed DNA polymerase [Bacteroidaceae bacterium]
MKREIFAADFRDRVVHHLIARRIYPLLERQFLRDSYSTQKGKGTLFGINRVERHITECSDNYTRDCWILKIDISGYFMSIDRQLLYDTIERFLKDKYEGNDLSILLWLLRKTIFNRPEKNCVLKVPRWRWKGLPKNKSLFGTNGKKGLPIGNLTSQLLALLFLDGLDHLVTEQWGVPHYGRYVDDMVLVHESKAHLLEVKDRIEQWLTAHGLRLHPKKVYLQHYSKGVLFVGGMIKPGRKFLSRRTVGHMISKIHRFNLLFESSDTITDEQINSVMATMNSYFGMMKHYASYHLFLRMKSRMSDAWYRHVYIYKKGNGIKLAKMTDDERTLFDLAQLTSCYDYNYRMAA